MASLTTAPPRPRTQTPPGDEPPSLPALLTEIEGAVASAFAVMEWAEDEIDQATARHPARADLLYHAFGLLCGRDHRLSANERLYRGHCRELLDRVAAGADTRPGTAAEVVLVCSDSSALAPLTSAGAGLYFRMWAAAGMPPVIDDATAQHYEFSAAGSIIDEHERTARRRLADPARRLDKKCAGTHHGEPATACRLYDAALIPAPDVPPTLAAKPRRPAIAASAALPDEAAEQGGLW